MIRGDKLPSYHQRKPALIIRGKFDHYRTKLEIEVIE